MKEQYDNAVKDSQLGGFLQELMLRITSEEDRVIKPQDIRWYKRDAVLAHRGRFNFFITTDFATSEKQGADYTVITVWAYDNNGNWYWVDGIREQWTMEKTLKALFDFVAEYKPMSVGVEVTGQQGGFIPWIMEQMLTRNVHFTLASNGNGNNPGIRPLTSKLSRFNLMVPDFKAGKMYFPEEARTTKVVHAFVEELSLITPLGFKSKNDDCIDNISMLPLLGAWKPGEPMPMREVNGMWEVDEPEEDTGSMSSYVV